MKNNQSQVNHDKNPTANDVKEILLDTLGKKVIKVSRLNTGNAHFVFEIITGQKEKMVVRLTRAVSVSSFKSAIYWYPKLKEKGVPLPELYYSSLYTKYPVMVLEQLPGKDLGELYTNLSLIDKKNLAAEMVAIQKTVHSLPKVNSFSYACSADDSKLHSSWTDVLLANLERSKYRLEKADNAPYEEIDQVRKVLRKHTYFEKIEPVAFLDDTTTKNVLVDEGKISGIVDVDYIAFGDPLLTVALTMASLRFKGFDTYYTDHWANLLELNSDQQKALHIYAAIFYIDFWSEFGQIFNQKKPLSGSESNRNKLKVLILQELKNLEKFK
jgi:aminoglycoside phosphotransferase (APT) family kinase protein